MEETMEKEPQVKEEDLTEDKLREIRQTTDWEEIQKKLEKYPEWKETIDRLYVEAKKLLDESGSISRSMKLKEVTSIVGESVRGSRADGFYKKVRMLLEEVDSPSKIWN